MYVSVTKNIFYSIGTSTSGSLKSISEFVDIHVYRIDTNNDVNAMEHLLKPHFPEVFCNLMKSPYSNLLRLYLSRELH